MLDTALRACESLDVNLGVFLLPASDLGVAPGATTARSPAGSDDGVLCHTWYLHTSAPCTC